MHSGRAGELVVPLDPDRQARELVRRAAQESASGVTANMTGSNPVDRGSNPRRRVGGGRQIRRGRANACLRKVRPCPGGRPPGTPTAAKNCGGVAVARDGSRWQQRRLTAPDSTSGMPRVKRATPIGQATSNASRHARLQVEGTDRWRIEQKPAYSPTTSRYFYFWKRGRAVEGAALETRWA